MKQFETKKNPKLPKFFCDICDFKTNNKKDYERHTFTLKHQNETNMKQNCLELPKNLKKNICNCGEVYNSRTSLWRHKKICEFININIEDKKVEPSDKELIMMLLKQNAQLIEQNAELTKNGINNTTNSNNINNSHNKSFNLQFFLNETCKDAMNIMDFVDSIKLQLSDLEKVGELGYVEGISSIITSNLKALDITQRPVHCTDKKREVLYVKDENKWEKEDENKVKIHKVIKKVALKNQRMIPKFKEEHPDCGKSTSIYSDQYNKIIMEAMGGLGNNDKEKEERIVKNISRQIVIDKDI